MTSDDHLAMAGGGTGTLLLSTSILGGENSPPSEGAAGNEPGLNRTNIFTNAPERKNEMPKWAWIILILVGLFLAWKYFAPAAATA